jgi:hypothetical protein
LNPKYDLRDDDTAPAGGLRRWMEHSHDTGLCLTAGRAFFHPGSLSMKKTILVGLAILAVSTSGALAAKKGKPKTPAAAPTANAGAVAPPMFGQVSAADRAQYEKNQRDSGMKKK